MDLFDKCDSLEQVKIAMDKGVYPYFHKLETRQAPEVQMEGKQMIMIGSNNYLGLTSHPDVIEAGVKALEQFGSGCSGSRFLNGTLTSHVELEKELAELNKELGLDPEESLSRFAQITSAINMANNLALYYKQLQVEDEDHSDIYERMSKEIIDQVNKLQGLVNFNEELDSTHIEKD